MPATDRYAAMARVRVLTLNINCDTRGLAERLAAAAADITAAAPDVVCLQEVLFPDDGPDTAAQLSALCGLAVVARARHDLHSRGFVNGLAVLSALPGGARHALVLPDTQDYVRRALAVELTAPSGRPLVVATAHLAWGGHRAPQRLAEASRIDAWCAELGVGPGVVTVLTGDFNASPDSCAVRFLTGREGAGGRGTYWVDAWEACGQGPGITSTPANPWVAATARFVGITEPSMIPARRQDYILVRGWAHGVPGTPLAARLCANAPNGPGNVYASDHYGVIADLWDPPLT